MGRAWTMKGDPPSMHHLDVLRLVVVRFDAPSELEQRLHGRIVQHARVAPSLGQ